MVLSISFLIKLVISASCLDASIRLCGKPLEEGSVLDASEGVMFCIERERRALSGSLPSWRSLSIPKYYKEKQRLGKGLDRLGVDVPFILEHGNAACFDEEIESTALCFSAVVAHQAVVSMLSIEIRSSLTFSSTLQFHEGPRNRSY